jgi:D-arabinose 1-dehydrogenase-like Zn-dependent alcohol dehydrogenase
VLVRLHASGICRSDVSPIDGKWPAGRVVLDLG